MFDKVSTDTDFVANEHAMLDFWHRASIFNKLRAKNRGRQPWSFLDGPITANNPMGVHHAWGRTYKDAYQRFWAMNGRDLRYQNGFDCQGLWVEVEVEKQLGLGTKHAVGEYGIDQFVYTCKKRVLNFAARQTEQSIRLGYWMEWDNPGSLRQLAGHIGTDQQLTLTMPKGPTVTATAEEIVSRLGNPEWGGSYFTFSTENNETIWTFLKKCFERGKIYRGHDVMPWSGRGGSAYSQMEVAEGRKLTTHKSVFVRFPLKERDKEYLLVWTTTPWTLTSNVAAAVNPQLEYVKLQAKRDGAIYYFAKENLEFQRSAKEFKEGFGRPEWQWPQGVPKLKSIAQIFKEQGGYEVLATLPGTEMVGWAYTGPFDDLPVQSEGGGFPFDENVKSVTGISSHRVVDGGRDNEGSPLVLAGEGTGIVHIAPGCGDVDHVLGKSLGLVVIAPLGEDGCFLEGFGDFTGRSATDRATAEHVFETLKQKGLLVAVEDYPHIYPHCWRTGDELVFRLVDEWFIQMDWRQEIMDVAKKINWLPESVDGLARELEWLTNMRDWMISKKRFWGLALPIWVDPDEAVLWSDPHKFFVVGSIAEMKQLAVEGLDEFEGHTPHRPWIDNVKIQHPVSKKVLSRVLDVGNPWLDAGIVAFSTMGYNTNPEMWKKWYPADLVTECFPGQFRNWFYALLSMSTMMDNTPPFKTLLGHRLVMDEDGKPMHKSDGTAIWFEEAAEQVGADTMRWMYLAQNPAHDLRFGRRHKDKPITLQFYGANSPATITEEGATLCEVTSKPADEIRRQNLITLWNTYAFFVNYARLDGFDPLAAAVPVNERPEIDRWILSNLQGVIAAAHAEIPKYNAAGFLREASRFIDDLSNWYIRRNRRRFWRSRDAGDRDKLAAYQTLYSVLVNLCKLLAPAIPFLTEQMYQNLVRKVDASAPESVHLCDYPVVDPQQLDAGLSERMALAQIVVNLGHGLREKANQRVRQPLAELRFACANPAHRSAIENLADVIKDELNVKQVTARDNLDDLVTYVYKPNQKQLGPKFGKSLGTIIKGLPGVNPKLLAPLRRGESVTVKIDGTDFAFGPEDVMVSTQQAAEWASADDQGVQIAISTVLSPELVQEGIARDFVRQIQQLRKDADLEIEQRIRVYYASNDSDIQSAVAQWTDYIQAETLANRLENAPVQPTAKQVLVGSVEIPIWIEL
ncbi:MAG: Isoleucine--tRNA ligase [Planctomycetaceae bacterium]|nr:Isoleucine--tRNA ligase [Planctomycetaceae bacterium]